MYARSRGDKSLEIPTTSLGRVLGIQGQSHRRPTDVQYPKDIKNTFKRGLKQVFKAQVVLECQLN